MKKYIGILHAIIALSVLASCNSVEPALPQNAIAPADLSTEQKEIVEILSLPNVQEIALYDFETEELYRSIEVWVEIYQNGELTDRPAGIGINSNTAERHSGRLAIIINRDDSNYKWTLSLLNDGAVTSHVGISDYVLNFSGGYSYGPMSDSAIIEDGKDIIVYSSLFAKANAPLQVYDEQTLQEHPELLDEYLYAFLIKCKFSK